ncbi:hypothetical protein JHD50_08625 [Sulfurimonas sp. MAG313]|nr:hypothetical protein [Sulfurimonas sp. MAG313]MDF1881363.1 hypothetical protein [Sulfurimonas sp. MAG313]
MAKTSFLVLLLSLVFLGCSSKEYYEPKEIKDSIAISGHLKSNIIELNGENATLEDGRILTKKGLDLSRFPQGYRFVYKNDIWALGLKTGGTVFAIKGENESISFKLPKTIATLALKDDLLAVVFADNELALYEFSTQTLLFKEPASESIVVDMRIASPRFLNDLVLFPTLDGRIVIINAPEKELVRTIIVSSEQYFNNIIYFNVVNDVLYAATPSKVYTLGEKEARVSLEARNMLVNEKGVWVATKQGEIIALDHALQVIKKQKFPFAHFLGIVATDEAVYVAEKEEYIISLKHDLSSYEVHETSLEEGFFYSSNTGFYFGDVYIELK